MKRLIGLLSGLVLLIGLCACGTAEETAPSASVDPSASVNPSASVSPSANPSVAPSVSLDWQDGDTTYTDAYQLAQGAKIVCYSLGTGENEGKLLVHDCEDSGQILQEIGLVSLAGTDHILTSLRMEDVNFDGFSDLIIPTSDNGAPNAYSVVYLWDNEETQFKYQAELSKLSNLQVNAAQKTLQSFEHNSAAESVTTVYDWQDGILTPLSKVEVVLENDTLIQRTYERDDNGELALVDEVPLDA